MNPYISFINFSRNDAYTPNRSEIQNLSLNFLIHQLKEYKIPSEIIIIEWNYPEDRPPLSETLQIHVQTAWTTLRIIRVPNRYHRKYKFSDVRHFHAGAALNVGIRRARGKFILPIASDVFLTDPCLELIAEQKLDEHSYYRCDRYDFDPVVLRSFDRQMAEKRGEFFALCEQNVISHHQRLALNSGCETADLHTNASGDFYLTARENLFKVRGSKEGKDVGGLDIDSLTIHALHGMGINETVLSSRYRVYKICHKNSTSRSVKQCHKPWHKSFELLLRKYGFSNKTIYDFRIHLNYPKRIYNYVPNAIFDSHEKNYLKPARRWAKKIPPFFLNDEHWGLKNESLEEVMLPLDSISY
jgi:glycosyltransferase involved in cell wall biosynthesis